MPSNVLPLHFKQTFPPMIGIFTEGEGDGIESRLPFKIFYTLLYKCFEPIVTVPKNRQNRLKNCRDFYYVFFESLCHKE